MLHYKIYENNTIFGVFYMFPDIGDQLPMHDHARGRKHNVIVLRGSVEVYGPDKLWQIILNAGDVFDFNNSEHYPHEITALEPKTEVLAIAIDGKHSEDIEEGIYDGHVGTGHTRGKTYEPYEFSQPKRLQQSTMD
jgi:hypothetical protein